MKNSLTIANSSTLENKTEISELYEVCSKFNSLVVSLFNVEQKKFEYCSHSFKEVLGYRPEMLVGSGWEFWYSLLKPKERPVVQHKLSSFIFNDKAGGRGRGYTIEYHIKNTDGDWTPVKHEISHRKIYGELIALNFISDNSERALIDRCLGSPPQIMHDSGISKAKIDVSSREKQVLKLIACGLSSRQIAKELYISRHTVISHRKNMIKKFGVKNTAELIKEASKVIAL